MAFMNDNGQVQDLSFEDIPNFIKEYIDKYAKPLLDAQPELSEAFQLAPVVDDLEVILGEETDDPKKTLPLLFVLWTNLVTRMARVETVSTAQQNYEALKNQEMDDVEQEEDKETQEIEWEGSSGSNPEDDRGFETDGIVSTSSDGYAPGNESDKPPIKSS